mgnify:CR=1 FL=1
MMDINKMFMNKNYEILKNKLDLDINNNADSLNHTISNFIDLNDKYDIVTEAEIITADGRMLTGVLTAGKAVFKLANPELWYPRGYGEQPLNTVTVRLIRDGVVVDEITEYIGFRKLTVCKDDEKGTFFFNCNGIDIFSMGANYIPLDQIFPYITKSRIHDFLKECIDANYNTLRIWGGGYLGEDNTVNVHVSNIRKKLAAVDAEQEYIKTVWGIGFKLA